MNAVHVISWRKSRLWCSRKRTALVSLVLAAVLFYAWAGISMAAGPQYPEPAGPVNDFANVLSAEDKSKLENLSLEIEKRTSAAVVVAIVRSTQPETPKTYAVNLFERWGIGRKGKDDGVLILLDMEQRRIEVETGYGLEGVLTDGRIGEILDRDVVPHFKKGDYGAGLYAGMQSMYRLIGSAHGIDVAPRDSGPAQGGARTGSSHAAVGVALMVVGVMMVFGLFSRIVGRLSGAGYGYGRRCPKCRSRLYVVDRIIRQGSMFGTGLAVKVYRCHSCGFHEEVEYQTRPPVIGPFIGPRWPGGSGGSGGFGGLGGGGSGGGFGGFGGGRSGGGGAGRSW